MSYRLPGSRDQQALRDLLAFAGRAQRLVSRGKAAYDTDEMLQLAGQKICIDIGEAATRLSDEFVAAHAEIAFRGMRGQRNFAAHRYDTIDPEIVWNTLAVRFPQDAGKIAELLGTD